MKRFISFILLTVFMLAVLVSCSAPSVQNDGSTPPDSDKENVEIDFAKSESDMFTDRDKKADYDVKNSITIQLNGDFATASSDSVNISGTTITITENVTHIISGTLNNGMIIVDADETAKLSLVFNGVDINCDTSSPLCILEADKVFITLAPGTDNKLSNGGTFTAIDENNIDGTIFSKQDLTINGTGNLTVTSPTGHGIVSKDDLVITGGDYNITSASHGLDANDSVRITGDTSLSIIAGKDGIHSENSDDATKGFVYISNGTIDIEAAGDGISAGSYLQIEDGTINILAGGGSENGSKESSDNWGDFMGGPKPSRNPQSMGRSTFSTTASDSSTSMKGIKAANKIQITQGNITVNSADDAIHSDVSLVISGGKIEIASGDDAIHAEESLTVTGGNINITESYEGLEALDINITGGDIRLVASDDGLNAAGGNDSSGTAGGRDGMFGGGPGGMGSIGGMGGMASTSSGSITISGGNIYINASGDGIDANGTLAISGGYISVVGPTTGDTATLDYDISGTITGGTFIGTGASMMAQTFSSSEQGVIAVSVGQQPVETGITLKDRDGNILISFSPELSYQVVILSSPDIVAGETYTLDVGVLSGEVTAS